jgi:galactokinase
MMGNIKKLWRLFEQHFQDTGLKKGAFSAPGRVNLIGEHTDYNDGFVLPMAIDKEIIMLGQLREDKEVRVYSLDYNSEAVFSLVDIEFDREKMWSNYLKGVMVEYQKQDYYLKGVNILFTGNIPKGSGLSSSAALEVATAYLLAILNELQIKPVEMALLCQRAENGFVGVNCGIMDQYISRLGKKGHALMIDCRTNEYELVPFRNQDYRVVICNSGVERGLVDSEYNQRRKECEEAVNYFARKLEHRVEALRDVSIEELQRFGRELPDTIFRRARHVITENYRVLTASTALRNGDIETLGKLMIESHESLRDDYQVSCKELDLLVELSLEQEGTLGARMTGAGFGGCTVSLVHQEHIDGFVRNVGNTYRRLTGIEPEIYVSMPADGAKELK